MNRFAAFWQSDGAPPDIEPILACGDELAKPAGARLRTGVRHNLAYVVASWSFPSTDSRQTEAIAFDNETVLLADARLDDRRSLAARLSRFLRCDIRLETSDARMLLHAWRAVGRELEATRYRRLRIRRGRRSNPISFCCQVASGLAAALLREKSRRRARCKQHRRAGVPSRGVAESMRRGGVRFPGIPRPGAWRSGTHSVARRAKSLIRGRSGLRRRAP